MELLLRLLVWGLLPLLLVTLAVGPSRSWALLRRLWSKLTERRHEPTEVINRVVAQHEKNIKLLREVLAQAEAAQAQIVRNVQRSEDNISALEKEARSLAASNDDLGASAALYKLNLERLAVAGFQEQRSQQKLRIDQTSRRLHLLELRLRQFEVGRSILLSQLAEAKTVEQQYALASQFDPFSAVSTWQQAEGTEPTTQPVSASEHVRTGPAGLVEPEKLEVQLADLKAQVRREAGGRTCS
jgi:phage shock protein A